MRVALLLTGLVGVSLLVCDCEAVFPRVVTGIVGTGAGVVRGVVDLTGAVTRTAVGTVGAVAGAAANVVGAVTGLTIGAKTSLVQGRKRRAAPSECLLPLADPDVYFSLAADADPLGCGLRLLCEVMATPDDQLAADELLLSIFGRQATPVTLAKRKKSPKAGFQWAAYVGSKVTDVSECAQVFNRCPFDRVIIMEAFRKAQRQDEEEV